ncbi:MAG: plasmid pRiA4b ORF-3 family protein [Candidatus Accumulibacter sp.]|jgi:hypothetical protein|nr:plasmid pRiA4b ORF-3 family protein [Accumulibacter sp.]
MSTPSSNKRAPAISATARLRLKIQLDGSRPAIWRRVEVDDNLTFLDLHRVIQEAMGWENCHLHEFNVAGQRLSTASADDDEFGESEPALPEGSTTLGALLQGQRKFRYWYDFGDDWWHTLTVEKSLSLAPQAPRAVLVDGARACPPEDCGGIHGYAEMLDILSHPDDESYEETREWMGEDFDASQFDLAAHARRVAAVAKR